ncbi:MAG: S-adenosylmethionine:tRNA ribosyltransferase-isomerase [Pseudomonadota bacterium]
MRADSSTVIHEIDFDLPEGRIARTPSSTREEAHMLVFNRATGRRNHSRVSAIFDWLRKDDLLVLNRASVDRVRVLWRDPKEREQELLLLRPLSEDGTSSRWEAIVSGKRLQSGHPYSLPGGRLFEIESREGGVVATIRLDAGEAEIRRWLSEFALPPVPPYIRSERHRSGEPEDLPLDRERYQTVFAKEGGAVAAPTAGLHFSEALLEAIRGRGIEIATVHLAVGWGTFQPLTEENWRSGKLHPEEVTISPEAAASVSRALREKRRVVAVGTTVVRTLEWWHQNGAPSEGLRGSCDLFLRDPWRPAVVEALLTNFHLPKSSLLALVAAFLGNGGDQTVIFLYREAIEMNYRFFSYGDCMLIV